MARPNKYASPEELRYAKVLEVGAMIGLVVLALSFAAYVSGLLPPLIPADQLPRYWALPAREFVAVTHTPTGWAWLALIGKGDVLNLAAIAFLGAVSAIGSLAVIPLFVRRGDVVHALVAVLQIVVLALAASNVLGAGR